MQNAIENKQPLLIIATGGGMKMQEGMVSLNQMARTTLAVNEVKAAGIWLSEMLNFSRTSTGAVRWLRPTTAMFIKQLPNN